jgi:NTP pyrophosphatase (non-canonical NTP hydrolase)
MDIHKFQNEVAAWSRRNFGPHKQDDPFLGVVEEVGEMAHAMLKARQGIRKGALGDQQAHQLIKDAIGDLVVFLADYCASSNIDLNDTIEEVWNTVKQRDWVKYPFDGVSR